ncbi:MAG TPA: LuxR C-terminal-related transcriptional regulator [Ktedonobacteraceae bacterium]|nr:LuxR C-terminal-related transcriptional regulator [Ktedonobacteraceae bacterium]
MAITTPHVFRRHLTYLEQGQEYTLVLEGPEWWTWLNREETRIFRFVGFQGHFTARRENKHGKWYWYAYRKDCGTLVKAYLGKSDELTEQHLEQVAQTITERCQAFRERLSNEALTRKPPTERAGVLTRRKSHQESFPPQSMPRSDGKAPEQFPFTLQAPSAPLSQDGSDEQVAAWHLKAARWYEQYGFLDDALQHLLAAHHFPEAAQVLERFCEQLMKSGKIATLLRWLQALPDEYIQSRPYLSLYYAGALLSTEQFDEAERHLRNAERAIAARHQPETAAFITPRSPHDPSQTQSLLNALAVTRASLAGFRGDVIQTMELSRQARSHFAKPDAYLESVLSVSLGMAYLRSGHFARAAETFRAAEAIGYAAQHLHLSLASASAQAYLLMEQGHLHQAAERYRQLLRLATEEERQPAALSSAYLGLGELHYDWNELDFAERSLRRGLDGEQHWEPMTALIRGSFFLARIHLARGETAEAFERLQSLEKHVLRQNLPRFLPSIGAIRAMLFLAGDDVDQAARWAREASLHVPDEINHLDEFPYLILAQVLARTGRSDDAALLLAQLLTHAETGQRMRSVVALLVCQATVLRQQGNDVQAQQALLRALSLAEPEGSLRVFIDQGQPIQALLRSLQDRCAKNSSDCSRISPYVNRLLTIIEREQPERFSPPSSVPHPQGSPSSVSLTTREREVLHLVALGLSNQAIAHELVVAVSTVKWHLKQISTKLAVHSRIQMLVRARDIHLL